jgi:hypothetical protein
MSPTGGGLSTKGPAGIEWKGIPFLLPLIPDIEGKTHLTMLVDSLNEFVIEPKYERDCEDMFAMVRKLFTKNASDQEDWISKAITRELVVAHQAIITTEHIAGVKRKYFVELLDSIHVEFCDRISAAARRKDSEMVEVVRGMLNYYYQDYDTYIYTTGDDIDTLLKIRELERTVPYVVRSLVTKFFHDVN